ncbi:DUF2975 domain-containing protein [Rhodopirellula sp. MGV]|uniref:DUF2975 domain-containing protein n=1 Tax=Rhodopirellula sp. MGV TaxID=2023130 RepID=UPI000B95EF08|nr:DUF2975 domain-containing protein [Rhodopirellula sp. MGV]OYP30489.1 hypothetical protein CGZ80_22150 [Rhodopirellula sp. MGV]PNY35204.1 DUF2975 domain-containing protein [Rhodopirellula baltica]
MSKKPISLSVLKAVVNVWWWGAIAMTAVTLLIIAFAPSDIANWELVGYASEIDASALAAQDRAGRAVGVQFDGPAKVKLVFNESNPARITIAQRAALGLLLGSLLVAAIYFVKQLRDIVWTIDQQDPFVAENARRMRTIGLLILAFGFFRAFGQLLVSGFADSMIVPSGFNLNGRVEFPVGLFAVGISVLVLSEVFRHGARMREEQSLTI